MTVLVSSRVSRTAASHGDSHGSMRPPGSSQRCGRLADRTKRMCRYPSITTTRDTALIFYLRLIQAAINNRCLLSCSGIDSGPDEVIVAESVLAFDIGGTWLKVAEVDRAGTVLWDDRATPSRAYPQDLVQLTRMVRRRSEAVVAAAFACPGPLDFRTGHVFRAANLNWADVAPGRDLDPVLHVPIVVENDADCAALAEATYGAGKNSALLVYYGIGTGVGSGVVEDGRIFHGGFDPEFGHQILEPNVDRYCTAGHRGCLESLISGGALERVFGSIDAVPSKQWEDVIPRYIGQALANATLFLSPDRIVLGGGVIDHRPELLQPSARHMEAMLHDFVVPPKVTISDLGREVGILGAAAAAWHLHDNLNHAQ